MMARHGHDPGQPVIPMRLTETPGHQVTFKPVDSGQAVIESRFGVGQFGIKRRIEGKEGFDCLELKADIEFAQVVQGREKKEPSARSSLIDPGFVAKMATEGRAVCPPLSGYRRDIKAVVGKHVTLVCPGFAPVVIHGRRDPLRQSLWGCEKDVAIAV